MELKTKTERGTAVLETDHLLLGVSGPRRGKVWKKGSTFTCAEDWEVELAKAELPGFGAALAACAKVEG